MNHGARFGDSKILRSGKLRCSWFENANHLTGLFPDSERFGLTNQLRRAAVSVPSNIAEGHGRGSPKNFLNFLWIANGSLAELETQVLLAVDLKFVSAVQTEHVLSLAQQVGRMLTGLRRSIQNTLQ